MEYTLSLAMKNVINSMETKPTVPQALYCFSPARFQLSLRAAATCSRASYRVKTLGGLDYKDLVCVVSIQLIPFPMATHLSFPQQKQTEVILIPMAWNE